LTQNISCTALLVIDIQEELTTIKDEEGSYTAFSFPRMISNTKRLIKAVSDNREANAGSGSEIIFTYLEAHTNDCRDVSLDYKLSGGLSKLPNASTRAKFSPGISPIMGKDIALPKTSCSVFQSTNLDYILRNLNIEQLVVCGQLTGQCVLSAVRDAADLGYLVSVVSDACGAENKESHERGISGMQGFARVVSTEQVLNEICGDDNKDNSSIPNRDEDKSATKAIKTEAAATSDARRHSIPKTSEYQRSTDEGCQAAILRSLRAAGVKFLRYTVVDAFNTIRCKTVPISHAMTKLPRRTQKNSAIVMNRPLDNATYQAEICFAGLPSHADIIVPASNLTGRNVLTLQPDFSSLRILPYAPQTAMIMCTGHNQQTKELSPLCNRGLLERVLQEARDGLGVEFCVGAELEFQLFHMETKDGIPQPIDMMTYATAATLNEQEEFIGTLYDQLGEQDIPIELIHTESAPGQLEVVLGYSSNVLQLADDVVLARETISACAKKHRMKAVFLPKTSMMTAGSGCHLHFSFRNVGGSVSSVDDNAFSDPTQPTGISLQGGSFIEGILDHLPSLLSFSLPTVNSFRRMGPGCWTGSSVGWSTEDKEVPLRVCVDLNTQEATNVELKLSDSTANIYLELAMILVAGMDGMKNKKKLRPTIDDIANEPLPNTLQESLDLLKKNELLLSVLGSELSTAYVAVRESEVLIEKTLEEEVMDAFNKA